MEKDSVFKQNVWNIMYGREEPSEHSSESEEVEEKITALKPEVKTYSVLPPPADYVLPDCAELKCESEASESEGEEEPAKKRRRKKRKSDGTVNDIELQYDDKPVTILTKNQKRKLKKKRQKEKKKSEAVVFTFVPQETSTNSSDVEKKTCDLINFFDSIWDVFQIQEKKTSEAKRRIFTDLNKSLKSLGPHNKDHIEILERLHKIKRLMLLGDSNAAGELITDLKHNANISIQEEECNLMVSLFEYWMNDIYGIG